MLSLTQGQKSHLQTMQNDVLRFAKNVRSTDRISRIELHKDANLLSLEQRREKQLYNLMYKLSKKGIARKVTNRNTRNQHNIILYYILSTYFSPVLITSSGRSG